MKHEFEDLGFEYKIETDSMWEHWEWRSANGSYGFMITHPKEDEWYLTYVLYDENDRKHSESMRMFNSPEELEAFIKE